MILKGSGSPGLWFGGGFFATQKMLLLYGLRLSLMTPCFSNSCT